MQPFAARNSHSRAVRPGLLAVALLTLAAGGSASRAAVLPSTEFVFRVDASRSPVEITARIPVREGKDFAFLGSMGKAPLGNLRVRDQRGARPVTTTDDPGIWRVDGLSRGRIEVSYTLKLASDCIGGSCRGDDTALLLARDLLIHPMGIDPTFPFSCRLEIVTPTRWSVVTPAGASEGVVTANSLAELATLPVLVGDQTIVPSSTGELLVVQSVGWQISPEIVGGMVAAFLREQSLLLGTWQTGAETTLVRIAPAAGREASLRPAGTGLYLLELPGAADRVRMSGALLEPLSELFHSRLSEGLSGAEGAGTRWWRVGFTEYTSLLAGIRSGAVAEQEMLDRLLEAWLNVSGRSPLAGRVSPAEAGTGDDRDARKFVQDSGLIACFLLDLQIRQGTGNTSGLGELLAATRGRVVDNALLQREASRLARYDMASLFSDMVLGKTPPPLPDHLRLAGLELTDVGTGEPFVGMALAEDEPVIERVFDSGPARARGLQAGDRIVAVDQNPVTTADEVRALLGAHAPGEPVEITVQNTAGDTYSAVLDLWERIEPTLRRSERASLAAMNAWSNLVRGEATAFSN